MSIRATKPNSVDHALARITDFVGSAEDDLSHLKAFEVEEVFIEFAMAVHFIARENFFHPRRAFCLWLAEKLYADFPAVANYDENGNWVGAAMGESQ